ncbi:hypothetical protein QKU48_gp0258 [Fadolivirus algeromassiliense]|jgi:NAD-specific glutamate dehydrogenase|uniref:Uncharacterized protein n=1 Tax=Fadolivirus FV1/VV64 TaxID=3070911 RepID=A0A7D3V7C7_9VIRU|nr:hypothetical protein QKU48_gp0258 [Fadolivirus algeromassiliense]QKF93716.1 hypothetical protein Fadolivirus_1_258 [Fadolivirus FV1/VV64]
MILELNDIILKQRNSKLTLETVYENIYQNIEAIREKYEYVLDPKKNNTTNKYLHEGYSEDEAYTLSFMTTLLVYLQVSGITISE